MKRLLLGFAAVLLAAGPLAAGAALARDHDGWGRGGERHEERGGGPGWGRGDGRGEGRGAPPGWVRGGERGPPPGWERREAPAPGYYGPPPGYAPPRPYGVRRGGYLPPEVRGGVIDNYDRYRLRAPPRGYNWVRVGNAFLLMNMSTGQIFDVIPD